MTEPVRPSSSTAVVSRKRSNFRPDIEGLRAFAVLLVVLSHLKLQPRGGFIGVDVFFVISGFLITGLVADEVARTGRFSIRGFYARRARRILPAALTVLIATWIAARIVFNASRFHQTVTDIWWSLGFAANLNYARGGTDYFQTYAPPSIVQHYWSLAVEEQFYVVWPLLLLGLTLVARRWAAPMRARVVVVATATAVVASFAYCLYDTASTPASAYFSTFGRAWELGLGAVLALGLRAGYALPARLAGPLSLLGVGGIVVSAFVISDSSRFPGPWAALPVLCTGVFLFAGSSAASYSTPWFLPVNNPLARYVGRISFSLYLWHWPVIQIVTALVPTTARIYYPLTLSAMAALTLFSYYAIEEVCRHRPVAAQPVNTRLAGARVRTAPAAHRRPRVGRRPALRHAAAIVALAALTLVFWTDRPAPPPPVKIVPVANSGVGTAEQALQQQLSDALQATSWPVITPPIDAVVAGKGTPEGLPDCIGATLPPADKCTVGNPDAPKLALVVGDSTAQAYMDVMKHFVDGPAKDWQIRFIGMAGCNFLDYRITNPVQWVSNACPGRKQLAVDTINALHPNMVILENFYANQINADTGQALTTAQWVSGESRYADKFRASTAQLVFLGSPVSQTDITQCYTAVSVPANCISRVSSVFQDFNNQVKALAAADGAKFIDAIPWFCVSDVCPAFVHNSSTGTNVSVRKDIIHITPDFADVIAPAAWEAFSSQGLFR